MTVINPCPPRAEIIEHLPGDHGGCTDRHLLSVQLSGAPGAGKTSLIEATVRQLRGRARVATIIAHHAAQRDAELLRACAAVFALDEPQADPATFQQAIRQLDPHEIDLLFIETPEEKPFYLAGCARVAVFSVAGGDDKAVEFPHRVTGADLVVLGKTDLLPLVRFDKRLFRADLRRLNPCAPLIELSARDGTGMEQWIGWLLERSRPLHGQALPQLSLPEWWFG